ncbi:MAG: GNAT family N-acetyltransferase [Polyangiaceae bacterium]
MSPRHRSRPAVPTDYPTFTRLFVELATGDPIPGRDAWEASIAPTMRIYEDAAGEVVAYSYHQVLGDTGYVRHVVVDPARRGERIGGAVMATLADVFRGAGCARWCLNVKPDNTPAVRLYESVGMIREYASASLHVPWSAVPTLPSPSREVHGRLAEPHEDAALDAAFGMPAGSLAASRKVPGRAVARLVDPSAPEDLRVGVASFDPRFPGAFPFRLADPSFARVMLETLQPYARPEDAHIGVVAEDDAALVRLLLDHGAALRMEILHYGGPLT